MADSKISALTALAAAPAAGDLLVLVDVSDTTMAASGTDKKITYANLTSALVSGATTFATSSAQTFTNGINGGTAANDDLTINGTSHATKTTSYVILQPSGGFVGIGTAAPEVPLHLVGTNGEIRLQNTAADASSKFGRLTVANYTNGALPFLGFNITSLSTSTLASFGGSSSVAYAVTRLSFYAAANNSTTTGTEIVRVNVNGMSVGTAADPTAVLHVAASTTARASVGIVAGTAPTTPVVGDIWNDGALSFYNADATTNAIVNHLRLSRDSTGTAAAGLGLGILAELESTTTSRQSAGRLTWEWATATHASRAVKGKLTAYYTSTEREAITWVADSSSARVGIMNAAPAAMLHVGAGADSPTISETIGYFSNAGTTAIAVRDSTNDAEAVMYISSSGAIYGTMTSHPVYFRTANNDVLSILANGNVGIGVTSPQGKLHGHDGSGGFLFVNQASVGGTLVTVIPDAAGDVTEKIFFVGWCTNSAPFSADVAPTTLAVSSSTTKTDGTNTLTIAVTAGGAFTLQATGGAATWNVNLWVFWR